MPEFKLEEIIEKFPDKLKEPLYLYFDYLREEFEIKRKEFEELKEIVKKILDAQQKTEERLNQLTERVEQLAIAQAKTEERLDRLTERVEQLAVAQAKTEERLNRLTERVEQLAIAQAKTEERLDRLTERVEQLAIAQAKTEERLNQLAIAQAKTEKELRTLGITVKGIKKELGGLSHSVGYNLENQAYKALPKLLKERYGIEVEDKLFREYLELPDGSEEEINIFGKGKADGKEIYILGEAKTNLTEKDIENFKKKVKKIEGIIGGEKFLIFVAHTVRPKIRKKIEEEKIPVFLSYEF